MASLWPHGAFNDHRGHPYMTSSSSRVAGWQSTLASGIDVGQGINAGPGQFGNENTRRALSTHHNVLERI